jgi:hypothetical protein
MIKRLLLLFAMVCALFFVLGEQSSTQAQVECDSGGPADCYTGWYYIGNGCWGCDMCGGKIWCE